ncbi:hypothetical protein DLAC_00216 [Tieghemostelium lacteum]|uniref:Uncharacterized protein n=1 Tax=Tieghemostelium lacteum TaxID=361077 RepID=A0A152A947_TIELA|nr:hypothetical protein DLAC_00216 [Tieghemostelium lacteum]|eukprot:KYR02753.1 hypothetical protein DLAC_00216 [Tieghemostelium lacteum]
MAQTNTTNIEKTKINIYRERDQNREYIKTWDNHIHLRDRLIKATKEFNSSCKKVISACGSDDTINNVVYTMNNIEGLKKKKSNHVVLNDSIETAEKLTALVNLTGELVHKHGIDFMLVRDTKHQYLK